MHRSLCQYNDSNWLLVAPQHICVRCDTAESAPMGDVVRAMAVGGA